MERFVDLGVSFFDEGFTLDPQPYLKELHQRDDILGFHADGMNFVSDFEYASKVIVSRSIRREIVANPEIEAREKEWAVRFPNRAKSAQLMYSAMETGQPDFKVKRVLQAFLDDASEQVEGSHFRSLFTKLSGTGRVDDYVESILTLPLRMMLEICGMPASERELLDLNAAGYDFLKAFDNYIHIDEAQLEAADAALVRVWRFVEEGLERAAADAPVRRLADDLRHLGLDDETIRVNLGGILIISLSNTAGMSSAFLLRNLLRYPDVRRTLAQDPALTQRDDVIMEFLRRDNHVKALSRQVHDDCQIGEFTMRRGESLNIFFPGLNLDPTQWADPLRIDFSRRFTGTNNWIFGGATYVCIGRKLGIEIMKVILAGLVAHLPEQAHLIEDEIEVDGDWVVERIIRKMPISLGSA